MISLVTEARAARKAVTAIFLLNGLMFGSWAARIPAVRDRVHLTDTEQGLALAFVAVGAVIAMPVAGALAARAGSRLATRVSLVVYACAVAIAALSSSLPVLCVGTFLLGTGMGALDVTMNAHGVAVERRYERPILGGFHAAFSAGGLIGGGLGSLAAGAGLDVRVHLAAIAIVAAGVGLAWSHLFLPAGEDAAPRDEPLFVRPPRALWTLGFLAFACLLIEGACADWSAVYLRDTLGSSAALGALAFTSFSVAMTLGRLGGDPLVERHGARRVVRAGGLLAATGFGIALLAATPAAGLVGFACLGAGMASVVPIVFRATGNATGLSTGVALAAVSSTGYLGFVVGPPAIGGIAGALGLRAALAVLVVLGAAVAALAAATSPRRAASSSPQTSGATGYSA
jgi:MFS family permease